MRQSRVLIAMLIGLVLLATVSCGKKQTAEERKPVVTENTTPKTETQTNPTTTTDERSRIDESRFRTVYFDFDKYDLRFDSRLALDDNAKLLKEYPAAVIRIEGHCDERGTVEYNLSLGEKRARSCMDYLAGLGVDQSRMSIISYGKERPATEGHSEAAWSKNRRAEFRVVSQGASVH